MEPRVYIISRQGDGAVYEFQLSENGDCILADPYPNQLTWHKLVDLRDFATVVHKNKLYVAGGYSLKIKQVTDRFLRFDPTTNTWKELSTLKHARHSCALTVTGQGRILMTGGVKARGQLCASSDIFHVETGQWHPTQALLFPLANHAMATCSENGFCQVFLSGGLHRSTSTDFGSVQVSSDHIWSFKERSGLWAQVDTLFPHRLEKPITNHVMVGFKDRLFIHGGLKSMVMSDGSIGREICCKLSSFTPGGSKLLNNLKSPFAFPNDETIAQSIQDGRVEPLEDRDWISAWNHGLPCPKFSRYNASAVAVGKYIYLFGGSSTTNADEQPLGVKKVEVYDTQRECWGRGFTIKIANANLSNVSSAILSFGVKQSLPSQSRINSLAVPVETEDTSKHQPVSVDPTPPQAQSVLESAKNNRDWIMW